LLIGLHSIGIALSILTTPGAPYVDFVRARGLEVNELPTQTRLGAAFAVRRQLTEKPVDVLYLDSTALSTEVIAATGFLPQPIVVRLSYLECCQHPGALARMLFRSRRVGCIFCDVSPVQAGDEKLGRALQQKISVIPAAHSVDWYARDVDLKDYGIPEGAFTVGSVSTETSGAALRWIVACAQWVPMDLPVHFLLVAPETDHGTLRRMIRKMPFTQRFHLTSNVEEAPGLLAASSVAVIPSWRSDLQRQEFPSSRPTRK